MIRGLGAHAALEFRTGVRDKTLLLMTYLFPLGFYAFMGVFMTEMNPVFAEVMIPGMTVFAMLAASMFGLPGPLISAREAGILRSHRIYGVPTGAVFGVPAATTVGHLMFVSGVIAATAPIVFDAAPVRNVVLFVLVVLIGASAHAGLGTLVGVISTDARISVLWSQLVFLPSVLLAGLIVPFDQIPELFQPLSLLLPATYAMEAFRGLAFGAETVVDPWLALGTLAVGAALAFALTRLTYSWDEHGSGRKWPAPTAILALAPYAALAVAIAL
jgi:ABC-2 type transport system permease protein